MAESNSIQDVKKQAGEIRTARAELGDRASRRRTRRQLHKLKRLTRQLAKQAAKAAAADPVASESEAPAPEAEAATDETAGEPAS